MTNAKIRVMVVDDNVLVRDRIVELLGSDSRVTVSDSAESGLLAFARISLDRPDVVLMDLEMPGIGGIAAIRRIKDLLGPPRVVVVTLHDSAAMRSQAYAAGADAFVTKSRLATDLLPTVMAMFPQAGSAAA